MLFFFNDTATTEIYTLSLHDALPIFLGRQTAPRHLVGDGRKVESVGDDHRSEEHTSELQSQSNLVCRLLLEKKKKNPPTPHLPRTVHSPVPASIAHLQPHMHQQRDHI